jgi:cation:H+ antiporter
LELAFTIAITLFVVAALATLSPEPVDAMLQTAAFLVQLLYPTALVRLGLKVDAAR